MKNVVVVFLVLACCAGLAFAEHPATSIEVRYGSEGKRIDIGHESPNAWIVKEGSATLSVKKGFDGALTLQEGDTVIASGRLVLGKLKLISPAKRLYAEIRVMDQDRQDSGHKDDGVRQGGGKIKVSLSDNPQAAWEVRTKPDELEVIKNGIVAGKVKYHAEEGKLKAKDIRKETVAELRPASALSAAPAVFLMADLQGKQRTLMMLVLMALGK